MPQLAHAMPAHTRVGELGANWGIQFYDADGSPLTMQSFETIDFGAISYKEIFQNVKTILTTPLMSAALERTLGIDGDIVDLPMGRAAEMTVAVMDALYFWEPRCEIMNIEFLPNTLTGQLRVNLQLKIKNVIFGTDIRYERRAISDIEPISAPILPPSVKPPEEGIIVVPGPPGPEGPQGETGPQGAKGQRGSIWFTGTTDPASVVNVQVNDMYLNTTTAAIFQFDGSAWRRIK